ncbi:MAG: hypothetical protein K2Y71_25535 [Xanthobacteraceae bacterium]|nr:hypothetical protein [Xanthobacteraceae bacterium]
MTWSHRGRAVSAGALILTLVVLPTSAAFAAKAVFVRSKPHVNVSNTGSMGLVARGPQPSHAKPKDPWAARAKFRCVRLEGSPGLYCR